MKRILVIVGLLFAVNGWAAEPPVFVKPCPKTLMVKECLTCHVVPSFAIREANPDARLVYPFPGMKIVIEGEMPVGHYLMTHVDADQIKMFLDYLDGHSIKKAVIEIHSPGGSLFDATRILGIIKDWQARGGYVVTKVNGMAFSAGFLIFTVGDERIVEEYAALMWHEIQSGGFGFSVQSISDKENEAAVLRGLQNHLHRYLATRCKLTKTEIDNKVSGRKQEWWMSGAEALSFGFATKLVK